MELAVEIRTPHAGFPLAADLDLREQLRRLVMQSSLGRIVQMGASRGAMSLRIRVEKVEAAKSQLSGWLELLDLAEHTSIVEVAAPF